MNAPIVVVGVNHRSAPVDLLERLTISEERLPKALHQLESSDHVVEGAVLSTCNRIEVYAVITKYHAGVMDLRNFLSEFCHVPPEDFTDHLYTYHDDGAIRHLFRVASGIDSMVIGESEILGQVRRAFQAAQHEGTAQRTLGRAFRQALRVGKRARSETGIARNPASISSAAVELARGAFEGGSLDGKRIVIVGAGKMGRLAVRALRGAGASEVIVVNRTEERAREIADAFGARPLPLAQLPVALEGADIVICSTTAPAIVIDRSMVETALQRRIEGAPLLIVDIAVPRDVERSVGELGGVVLRDIDDLRGVVESGIGSRLSEVSNVEKIIANELEHFLAWERANEIVPAAARLVARAEEIRLSELDRLARKLKDLSPEERRAVDRLTRKIVAKMTHDPLQRARELSSSKQGHLYLTALRELFELDDEPPE
jgi:glutamyl-tRNA reductase